MFEQDRTTRQHRGVRHRRAATLVEVLAYALVLGLITSLVATTIALAKRSFLADRQPLLRTDTWERLADAFQRDIHAAQSVALLENGLRVVHDSAAIEYLSDEKQLRRVVVNEDAAGSPLVLPLPESLLSRGEIDAAAEWAELRLENSVGRIHWRVVARIGRDARRNWSTP